MSNFNPMNSRKLTTPAIFPCKVDKFGGKLVNFALSLPAFWRYSHTIRVYLKSGADCSPGATVNTDEKPLCSIDMYTGDGTCAKRNNVWISDRLTQGAQSCVCLLLYCELGKNTWA